MDAFLSADKNSCLFGIISCKTMPLQQFFRTENVFYSALYLVFEDNPCNH